MVDDILRTSGKRATERGVVNAAAAAAAVSARAAAAAAAAVSIVVVVVLRAVVVVDGIGGAVGGDGDIVLSDGSSIAMAVGVGDSASTEATIVAVVAIVPIVVVVLIVVIVVVVVVVGYVIAIEEQYCVVEVNGVSSGNGNVP